MTWVGWIFFTVSQIAIIGVVGTAFIVCFEDEDVVPIAIFLTGGLAVADVLTITGVLGPGWPLPAKTSALLLLSTVVYTGLVIFLGIQADDGNAGAFFGTLAILGMIGGVALLVFLMSGDDEPTRKPAAKTARPAPATSPPAPTPVVTTPPTATPTSTAATPSWPTPTTGSPTPNGTLGATPESSTTATLAPSDTAALPPHPSPTNSPLAAPTVTVTKTVTMTPTPSATPTPTKTATPTPKAKPEDGSMNEGRLTLILAIVGAIGGMLAGVGALITAMAGARRRGGPTNGP